MRFCKRLLSLGVLAAAWHVCALSALASEAGQDGFNPLKVDPDLAIVTGIVFLLLAAFLGKFAWKPLMEGLDRREQSIANMIEQAKRSSDEAARKLEAYEAKLAAATSDAEQIIAQARRDAAAAGEKLLADARAEADRERRRALDDITSAKNQAVREIARQSADMAFLLARKLIRRELKPEDHAALVRETLERFPSEN